MLDRVGEELDLLTPRLDHVNRDLGSQDLQRDGGEATSRSYVDDTKGTAGLDHEEGRQAGEDLLLHDQIDRPARHQVHDLVSLPQEREIRLQALLPVRGRSVSDDWRQPPLDLGHPPRLRSSTRRTPMSAGVTPEIRDA